MADNRDIIAPRAWRLCAHLAIVVTVLMALWYGHVEWQATGGLADLALIVLVTVNAVIAQQFGLRVAPQLGELYGDFPQMRATPQAAVDATFWHPLSLPFALVYAAVISLGVWILDPWSGTADLRLWLSAFVFAANVVIGLCDFTILRFWQAVHRTMPHLDLRLLNLSRPPLVSLLRVNSQVVTVTALIACLSILAIVMSGYETDPVIFLFSLATLGLVVATYAVPIVPLANRLNDAKLAELSRLEPLIEAHIRTLTHQDTRPDLPRRDKELPELERLLAARDMVSSVSTLPPGGQVSVSAAGIVTFLSFLPAIVDYILSNVM
jgi:predicted outer membrane lipoprotein